MRPFIKVLKVAFEIEDDENEGTLTLSQVKECFKSLECLKDDQIDEEHFDYLLYILYQKSESLEKLQYGVLYDLIEGKLLQNQLSAGSEGGIQGRRRPESSSPQKIKARNKEKLQQEEQKRQAKTSNQEEDEDDNYEEEFEKMLDQDDDDNDKSPSVPAKKLKGGQRSDDDEGEAEENKDNEEEDKEGYEQQYNDEEQLDEEQMLDIAESCFVRIAEAIISSQ